MQRQMRLKRELEKLEKDPSEGIFVYPKEDRVDMLEAKIIGPSDSPYENGLFQLDIHVPENYPFSPPTIKFVTKIYHPNIDDSGRICMDLIKMHPKGRWNPTMGLEGLLTAVRMLLSAPNIDDPLMAEIAHEYKNNYYDFVKKAKCFTEKYAK